MSGGRGACQSQACGAQFVQVLPQVFRRATGRGGGVVQLVGQARRQRSQRGQPLALAGYGLQDLDSFGHRFEDLVAEGGMLAQQAPEEVVGYQEQAAVRERPPRREEGRAGQQRDLGEKVAGRVSVYDHLAAGYFFRDPELSFEYDVEVFHGLAFPSVDLASGDDFLQTLPCHLQYCVVREAFEEGHAAQFVDRRQGRSSGRMGSRTWKRVSPGSERTRMSPLWSSTTTRWEISRPSPVPLPMSFVV